jgi:transcriptional/translational regulatory protein YebC/TACO1
MSKRMKEMKVQFSKLVYTHFPEPSDAINFLLQFICDPAEIFAVQKSLQNASLKVLDSDVEYIANTFVTLTKESEELVDKMFSKLDEVEEIIRIHDNIKFEE